MMKPKTRLLWMRLHAYIACFFLPAAILYAITGGLYLVGFEGDAKQEYEYHLELENGWPEDKGVAREIVLNEMKRLGHLKPLPTDYYLWEGMHDWFGFKREVLLVPEENGDIELKIIEHDILRQLLLIHKGFAGKVLKIFSILWGFSLIFSQLSGVILALGMKKIRTTSLASIGLGLGFLVTSYFMG